jgi:nitrogen fixation/metabolism regulation signal transduction histidine kinase
LPASVVRPAFFGDQNIRIRQGEIYHQLSIGKKREAILKFDAQEESMNIGLALKQIILTLLNIYVFLFVFTGGIAVAVSNSITAPLKVLSERLKSLKLGKKNVPLNWEKKDELGELIKDYNRMILQLEESAKILATKERETAWREMAKQVAHEIKNPLTPMKLSLQHLQFAIENNSPNKEKMFAKVSATLIEQIDNLNRIASEFSSFAKMPEPENKEVSLNEVVASIHDLFRERKDMDIRLFVPIDDLRVFADKDHLLRVMSNLIKNAIQAIPEERRGKIVIKLYKEKDKAVILVADNGKGIKDELKEKVFKPNFTSKSSGTGLGLAICANIIEGFNGKIYFETEVNKGTDFYVVIPLMRTKENFFQRERVTL